MSIPPNIVVNDDLSFTFAVPQKTGKMPSIAFHDETDTGQKVTLTLAPEPTITAIESLKLSMLLHMATSRLSYGFSPYLYIQEQNLERHFKITVQ